MNINQFTIRIAKVLFEKQKQSIVWSWKAQFWSSNKTYHYHKVPFVQVIVNSSCKMYIIPWLKNGDLHQKNIVKVKKNTS